MNDGGIGNSAKWSIESVIAMHAPIDNNLDKLVGFQNWRRAGSVVEDFKAEDAIVVPRYVLPRFSFQVVL